jgi:hypothetical protein
VTLVRPGGVYRSRRGERTSSETGLRSRFVGVILNARELDRIDVARQELSINLLGQDRSRSAFPRSSTHRRPGLFH